MNTNLAYQDEWDIREELIDGEVIAMSPRPAWRHMSIAGNIYRIFGNYLEGKICVPIMDGCDLFLTEKDRFVPDMMVVCDRSKIKANGVHGAPDLVVEVLSRSTAKRDRGYKMQVYARCGVREYWIVDPNNRLVEVYLLRDGQLLCNQVYALYEDWELEAMKEEERAAVVTRFQCSLYDDLEIDLEDVFYNFFPELS